METKKTGKTILMLASENGDLEACRILLGHGAQVNAKDDAGRTSLMYSIIQNHDDVVQNWLKVVQILK